MCLCCRCGILESINVLQCECFVFFFFGVMRNAGELDVLHGVYKGRVTGSRSCDLCGEMGVVDNAETNDAPKGDINQCGDDENHTTLHKGIHERGIFASVIGVDIGSGGLRLGRRGVTIVGCTRWASVWHGERERLHCEVLTWCVGRGGLVCGGEEGGMQVGEGESFLFGGDAAASRFNTRGQWCV